MNPSAAQHSDGPAAARCPAVAATAVAIVSRARITPAAFPCPAPLVYAWLIDRRVVECRPVGGADVRYEAVHDLRVAVGHLTVPQLHAVAARTPDAHSTVAQSPLAARTGQTQHQPEGSGGHAGARHASSCGRRRRTGRGWAGCGGRLASSQRRLGSVAASGMWSSDGGTGSGSRRPAGHVYKRRQRIRRRRVE